jgi:hypothetical protein
MTSVNTSVLAAGLILLALGATSFAIWWVIDSMAMRAAENRMRADFDDRIANIEAESGGCTDYPWPGDWWAPELKDKAKTPDSAVSGPLPFDTNAFIESLQYQTDHYIAGLADA